MIVKDLKEDVMMRDMKEDVMIVNDMNVVVEDVIVNDLNIVEEDVMIVNDLNNTVKVINKVIVMNVLLVEMRVNVLVIVVVEVEVVIIILVIKNCLLNQTETKRKMYLLIFTDLLTR